MFRWALGLALLLALPTSVAFPTTQEELLIRYDAHAPPVIIAVGELGIAGSLSGGLFTGGLTRATAEDIGQLVIVERGAEGPRREDLVGATLVVEDGGLLWNFENGSLDIDIEAAYALGLALPEAPFPADPGDTPPPGFLLTGESFAGSARWRGGSVTLVPLDAVITIRDVNGLPLADWNERRVNTDAKSLSSAQDEGGLEVVFRAEGGFLAQLDAQLLAGATGSSDDVGLIVSHAAEDRFSQALAVLDKTSASFAGEGGPDLSGDGNPLQMLEQGSGLLNGALLIIPENSTDPSAAPLEARWGTQDFALGAFNLVRGDGLQVRWEGETMRVTGEPTVALGREGFAIEPPARVGVFPIVSLAFWALAIASIVFFFVKRPPKGNPQFPLRLLSFAIWLVALIVTVYVWDRSFTATFGTGVLAIVKTDGINPTTLPRIGVIAALEFVPWSIAGLLFALPVRIVLGVGLRYLGKGKSYKGIATAGGLVSLAILGPIFALWCFNLVWAQAARSISGP
jgi:hypothetical protein